MPPKDGKNYPNIKLALQGDMASLDRVRVEMAVLEAMELILQELIRYHERVLYGDERQRKWLKVTWRSYMWSDGRPLTLIVDRIGPVQTARVLTRMLTSRQELARTRVRVTVSNQKGDHYVLVFHFTSVMYPAT